MVVDTVKPVLKSLRRHCILGFVAVVTAWDAVIPCVALGRIDPINSVVDKRFCSFWSAVRFLQIEDIGRFSTTVVAVLLCEFDELSLGQVVGKTPLLGSADVTHNALPAVYLVGFELLVVTRSGFRSALQAPLCVSVDQVSLRGPEYLAARTLNFKHTLPSTTMLAAFVSASVGELTELVTDFIDDARSHDYSVADLLLTIA